MSGLRASHSGSSASRSFLPWQLQLHGRQRDVGAAAIEERGEPQREHHVPVHVVLVHLLGHLVERAAVGEHEQRDRELLVVGEARHVGVVDDVGGMLVIAAVGDRDPDLVQLGGPRDALRGGLVGLARTRR